MHLSQRAVRNLSLGAPQWIYSYFKFFSFFLDWWPCNNLRSRVPFRVVPGSSLDSTKDSCEHVAQDSLCPCSHCCKYQCICFWHALPEFLIWPKLAYSFSLFASKMRVGKERECMWFQWNNVIDFHTAGKQRTSPVRLQELLYLLKILLGVWVVGENFQITAAYIRNCPPLPCLLCGLTHSPSLLLVLCQDISSQAFKISTLYLPLPLLNAAAEREKVW